MKCWLTRCSAIKKGRGRAAPGHHCQLTSAAETSPCQASLPCGKTEGREKTSGTSENSLCCDSPQVYVLHTEHHHLTWRRASEQLKKVKPMRNKQTAHSFWHGRVNRSDLANRLASSVWIGQRFTFCFIYYLYQKWERAVGIMMEIDMHRGGERKIMGGGEDETKRVKGCRENAPLNEQKEENQLWYMMVSRCLRPHEKAPFTSLCPFSLLKKHREFAQVASGQNWNELWKAWWEGK